MGFSEKPQVVDLPASLDSDAAAKKWVIAGIPLRAPLKPIYTASPRPVDRGYGQSAERDDCDRGGEDHDQCYPTTPTAEETRIPAALTCPPAPRKRKAPRKCNYGVVREFFNPPDLETVFALRHVGSRAI